MSIWLRRSVPLLLLLCLVACQSPSPTSFPLSGSPLPVTPPPTPPVTPVTPTPTVVAGVGAFLETPIAVETTLPQVGAQPWRVALAEDVPAGFATAFSAWISDSPTFALSDLADAEIVIGQNGTQPLARWFYAPVAPFITLAETTTLDALQTAWLDGTLTVPAAEQPVWTANWGDGEPLPGGRDELWAAGATAQGLLPFEALRPDVRVLALDGWSVLAPGSEPANYPLVIELQASGDENALEQLLASYTGPRTNRNPELLTTVALTGVTALTRATAYQMEINGVLYPGQDVGDVLRAADIAHLSHEVAFAADCPFPDPFGSTTFCARDAYLDLIVDLGIDVVELTGNHVNDWGAANLARSVELYRSEGMETYGGGVDLATAALPAIFNHNGNQVAFLGCNPVGPAYAWATPLQAGSNPCDNASLQAEIGALSAAGVVVIVTIQDDEHYAYQPLASQQTDFRAFAAAGAAVVSGSHAHHVQGFDFYGETFIHHGPGNLFFDQMNQLGTRQTVVDTLTIYDGQLRGVTMWTGLIENFARPREMTPAERTALLQSLFAVTTRTSP